MMNTVNNPHAGADKKESSLSEAGLPPLPEEKLTGLPEDKMPELAESQLPVMPKAYEALTATQLSSRRTQLSTYRTQLSTYRTRLSMHRTELSDHRTSLSTLRTGLSTQRTGLSFQRTRLSADRTLMSIMRTSLSLIGFGFTIFQFFHKLREMVGSKTGSNTTPRFLGFSFVILGIGMLAIGIWYHVRFMRQVRKEREHVRQQSPLPQEDVFPISLSLLTAVVLLLIGLITVISMASETNTG